MKRCPWCQVALKDPAAETCTSHRLIERDSRREPDPGHALRGGRWVPNGRGTLDWQVAS